MTRRFSIAMLAAVALTAALSGCEKPLFPEDAPRTPYDRYMVLRGQQRPATEENAAGGDRPALRQRLKPLGQP